MNIRINRGRENKFYLGVVTFLVISFAVFFTSKMWMYDDNPINQTPFYTEIAGLEQTKIILQKWEYNPDKELMEVILEMKHTGADTVKPTFAFAAKESKSLKEYPVEVMYQHENNFVLHIRQVPIEFRVVGLFVKEMRDKKILESELKAAQENVLGSLDQDGEMKKITLPQPKEKIIVGDYRKIKVNRQLENKSKWTYQQEQIDIEIKLLTKQIQILEKEQMPLQDAIIVDIKKEIAVLEDEMKFQTESEKQETRQQIINHETDIGYAEEKKISYKEEANELREKRKMLLVKRESIRLERQKRNAHDDKKDIQQLLNVTKENKETSSP